MTAPVPTSLPYGLRDVKIYPYLDEQGTQLATTGFDLPNAQTFSFADSETYTDLRGDDELIATHGNGAQVKWTLEAGGIELQVWAVLTGGQIIESGAAPNRKITLRKCSDDTRPYFKVVGKIMSDSGGDVDSVVYRAKCNGDIRGQFGDGKFFVTAADGVGLPMPGSRLLYDIDQHETATYLTTTPDANPIMPPKNMGVSVLGSTTATIVWEPVTGATGYKVQYSDDDGATWTAGTDTVSPTSSLTTLTDDTDYLFQIATKIGTDVGLYSQSLPFHTIPA